MKAKLISKEYGEFVFDQLATIGRAQGSTVTLEATVVSNEHARISFEAQRSAYVLACAAGTAHMRAATAAARAGIPASFV